MDRGKRRSVVVLSSSSSELEDSAEESQDDLHDAVDGETSSYSTSGDDDSDVSGVNDGEDDDIDSDYLYSDDDQAANEEEEHEETSSDDDACGGRCDGDDDSQYKFVIQLLQVGGREEDLRKLTLRALRIYLRRHGLRISGSKDVCLKRIQEHWRIKDGNGDVIYPRSSFSINCKGDVCKGDVVLFIQKVYKKFDKAKRCGEVLGSRTVAGQVVKESYGAAKQQHTFTVSYRLLFLEKCDFLIQQGVVVSLKLEHDPSFMPCQLSHQTPIY